MNIWYSNILLCFDTHNDYDTLVIEIGIDHQTLSEACQPTNFENFQSPFDVINFRKRQPRYI